VIVVVVVTLAVAVPIALAITIRIVVVLAVTFPVTLTVALAIPLEGLARREVFGIDACFFDNLAPTFACLAHGKDLVNSQWVFTGLLGGGSQQIGACDLTEAKSLAVPGHDLRFGYAESLCQTRRYRLIRLLVARLIRIRVPACVSI